MMSPPVNYFSLLSFHPCRRSIMDPPAAGIWELGPFQLSQMTASTKKDLTLCHDCPLTLWSVGGKNSARLPKTTAALLHHPLLWPTPSLYTPTLLSCPYLSADPGRVHKRPIRSIAGHIYKWKRPNNGAVREKNEETEGHSQMWRWVGRWGGGRKEQRPIVTKHPSMEGRKKPGLRGGDEAMPALYTRTLTGVMKGGKKKRK